MLHHNQLEKRTVSGEHSASLSARDMCLYNAPGIPEERRENIHCLAISFRVRAIRRLCLPSHCHDLVTSFFILFFNEEYNNTE